MLWQSHDELDVIVVDEASTDDTPAFLESVKDERVRVLRNDDPVGVAAARNRALEAALGDYIAYVDDDDMWAREKIATQLAAIDRTGGGWAYVEAMVVDARLRPIRFMRVPPADGLYERLLRVNEIPGGASGILARRDLVREVGGSDPSYKHFADWDLYIRLARRAPAAAVAQPLLAYLRHQSMSNVPAGKFEDIELIDARYADERARLGVPSNRVANLFWVADTSLRAGDRREAIRALGLAAQLPDNRHARLRQVLHSVPGWLQLYDELKRWAIPREKKHLVVAWLADLEREVTAFEQSCTGATGQ